MSKQAKIRILIVDDHWLFREGIAAVINDQPDMLLIAEAANGSEALERFREQQPDVTLMDLRLGDSSGLDAIVAIRTDFPEARFILVSTFRGDIETRCAMDAGACGHIFKTMHPKEIVEIIREVHAGRNCVPLPVHAHFAGHLGGEPLSSKDVDFLADAADARRKAPGGRGVSICELSVRDQLTQTAQKLDARNHVNALTITGRRGFIRL
jgi:DNA-binding NarL/FixJ family response regulator